jgi:hypothetical protein
MLASACSNAMQMLASACSSAMQMLASASAKSRSLAATAFDDLKQSAQTAFFILSISLRFVRLTLEGSQGSAGQPSAIGRLASRPDCPEAWPAGAAQAALLRSSAVASASHHG